MTTKRTGLVLDFARKDPSNFAAALEQSSEAEITEILQQLPNAVAASVLARLSPRKAESLLLERSPAQLEWIADSSLEDAKAILVRLPKIRRKSLVKKLPNNSHRMQLQRFLNYPKHSLGRYVSNQIITVPLDMSAGDVIELIKSSTSGLPVVVTDASSHYVGLLDARQVIEGSSEVPIRKCIDKVSPLLAESSLVDAMEVEQWRSNSILAVIDHEGHVLGVISRDSLLRSLDISPEITKPINSVLTVFQLYIRVLVKLSETLFRIRHSS